LCGYYSKLATCQFIIQGFLSLNLADQLFFLGMPRFSGVGIFGVGIDLQSFSDKGWATLSPFVTSSEMERARRFHRHQDGTNHLAGRGLVRILLAKGNGIVLEEFQTNSWGKPVLPECGFEFSISHAGNVVWVALCRSAAVGIDVEELNKIIAPHDLCKVFHPLECAEIQGLPEDEAKIAFLRCWTRKEAVVKALGQGLSATLDNFRVRTDEANKDWLIERPVCASANWTCADLQFGKGYQVSLAAMAPQMPVTSWFVPAGTLTSFYG